MIRIVPMKAEHIPDAVNLWKEQFVRYCYSNSFPLLPTLLRHMMI